MPWTIRSAEVNPSRSQDRDRRPATGRRVEVVVGEPNAWIRRQNVHEVAVAERLHLDRRRIRTGRPDARNRVAKLRRTIRVAGSHPRNLDPYGSVDRRRTAGIQPPSGRSPATGLAATSKPPISCRYRLMVSAAARPRTAGCTAPRACRSHRRSAPRPAMRSRQ